METIELVKGDMMAFTTLRCSYSHLFNFYEHCAAIDNDLTTADNMSAIINEEVNNRKPHWLNLNQIDRLRRINRDVLLGEWRVTDMSIWF